MTPEEEIAGIARRHLSVRHPGGAKLDVLVSGISHDQEWWYVPVVTDREQTRRYEYYEVLGDVEREIQQEDGITVLFVPTRTTELVTAAYGDD